MTTVDESPSWQDQQRIVSETTAELNKTARSPAAAMDHHEKMRLRAAAHRCKTVYPGAVGELVSREILTWEEFGYRFGASSLIKRVVDQVMKAEVPAPTFVPPPQPAVGPPKPKVTPITIEGSRG